MAKKSNRYPDYSGGEIKIDGRTVATANKNGNTISTNYNMSDTEKNIYDQIQSGMETSLGNLMNISDPQREAWNQQLNAIKERGISNINDIFTPMETNLRNDVASRFGNLDNSVFMDNLNKITDKKSQAVSDLSNTLLSTQDSLYANELANRINIITLLNNLNSAINNNMLNYVNAAASNAQSGNAYNQNAYTTGISSGLFNTGLNLSDISNIASNIGDMATATKTPWGVATGKALNIGSKILK